ncbi:LytTR family transcriptional regulator DNA-binding domain-containing protein [Fluviicola sp.]|uniref:LytTR family transcriptional regulator DNA-binding domain-containing protein n=1 Tax=Fluviicola sp. TaxID=1917219 RepID=UPI003D297855
MTFLNRQIHFTAAPKRKVLVGFILFLFLSFVIIFVEPFDTDQYHSDHKILVLSGFGILIFFVFVIYSSFENLWYLKFRKVWLVSHEIASTILFFVVAGSVLYLYNGLMINQGSYSITSHLLYLKNIVLLMIPVFAPVMLYLRQQFGERIVPLPINSVLLTGENKNEVLSLEKGNLLFIKAFENYVEIHFLDEQDQVVSRTFRQTLSNVYQQIPFLEKCHRSYLVNMTTAKEIIGNSQSAKISFIHGEKTIPLSKTYYKQIKNRLVQK